MAEWVMKLLRKNYDKQHGIVNSRPVVDEAIRRGNDSFREVAATFDEADIQWRLPLLEAMRTLAASGHCSTSQAAVVLDATETVARESGVDEFFKSVNALASSSETAPALISFVTRQLDSETTFARRLAFYVIGMLAEHDTSPVPENLRERLRTEAGREQSAQQREQFFEVLNRV